jgi:hypothetical protein
MVPAARLAADQQIFLDGQRRNSRRPSGTNAMPVENVKGGRARDRCAIEQYLAAMRMHKSGDSLQECSTAPLARLLPRPGRLDLQRYAERPESRHESVDAAHSSKYQASAEIP